MRLNAEKQLMLSRAFQEDKNDFTETEISDMINNIIIKSDITNRELLILEKFYAAQDKLKKQNQKALKENVDFEANLLKKQAQEKVKKSLHKTIKMKRVK